MKIRPLLRSPGAPPQLLRAPRFGRIKAGLNFLSLHAEQRTCRGARARVTGAVDPAASVTGVFTGHPPKQRTGTRCEDAIKWSSERCSSTGKLVTFEKR